MEKLPPIPTPAATLLREFRIRFLPIGLFAAVLFLTVSVWKQYVGSNVFVGEVEAVRAIVSSSQPGRVTLVRVGHLQRVSKGDPVVQILSVEPRVIEAQIALSKARIELLRINVDPRLRKENNQINYASLRLEWMQRRAELAGLRARLVYYENEFKRVDRLFRENTNLIASVRDHDIASRDVEVTRLQIVELDRLVQEGAAVIRDMEPGETADKDFSPVVAAIKVEEKQLELIEEQMAPIILISPIDGVVSTVHRRDGENVTPGEPILTISASSSERVLAYVKLPITREPKIGDSIEIRSRSLERQSVSTTVVGVGAQLESIRQTLLPPTAVAAAMGGQRTELGLPIVIAIPAGFRAYPGEIVDLRPIQP